MKIAAGVCFALVLTLVPHSLNARAGVTHESLQSPREFVASFYQWYVPHAVDVHSTSAWNTILQYKQTAMFSPQLAQLLQEDSTAQDRCNDLVGLDFDPFLASQDPADRYDVGRISQKGHDYMADIYSAQAGKRGRKPVLRAEFSEKKGHWLFVDFYYPDGGDLLTLLESPKLRCSDAR